MRRPATWKVVTIGATLTGLGVIGAAAAMTAPPESKPETTVLTSFDECPGRSCLDRPGKPGPGVLPPPGHLQQLPGVPPPGHWGLGPVNINPGWVNHL